MVAGAGDGMFNSPMDVVFDSGFLYVADYSNHRVVKVNASTGAFVGAMGRTSATTGTCPATGATSSWCTGGTFVQAVSGTTGFSFPTGVGAQPGGRYIYVGDEAGRLVRLLK